jgi:hypothetical protein
MEEKITPVKVAATSTQTAGRFIYYLLGVLEFLLVFRLIFKLAGASQGSAFVSVIYSISRVFILPFSGIFRSATATGVETTAVFEPATLVAIVVYALLAWGLVALVRILSGEREPD